MKPRDPDASARVDEILEQVLQNYAEAAAPSSDAVPSSRMAAPERPAAVMRRPLPAASATAAPTPRAVAPRPSEATSTAAGTPPGQEARPHAVSPPRPAPAPTTPAPPRPSPRLFPPQPQTETYGLPLQLAQIEPVHRQGDRDAATPPPRNTRTRVLIALLVLLLALQSAWIVMWMRSGPVPLVDSTSAVTITSDPAGSVVMVDGSTLGVTPLTTELAAGTHELRVGDEAPQTISVEAGASSTMHVVLAETTAAALTGSVEISTEPPGAAVTVDGVARGVAPVRVADLPPGTHAVTLARRGRLLRRSVTVQAGASTSLVVAMEEGGAASGWLTVTSPVPARIYADGTLIGRTDTPRTLLTAGRHQLVLENESLNFREERTVEVGPGRTVSLVLAPVNGTININAQPWASVWIDGTAVGETPIGNYSVPIGTHEVVFRHPQLGERRQTVSVGVGAPAKLAVDLRK